MFAGGNGAQRVGNTTGAGVGNYLIKPPMQFQLTESGAMLVDEYKSLEQIPVVAPRSRKPARDSMYEKEVSKDQMTKVHVIFRKLDKTTQPPKQPKPRQNRQKNSSPACIEIRLTAKTSHSPKKRHNIADYRLMMARRKLKDQSTRYETKMGQESRQKSSRKFEDNNPGLLVCSLESDSTRVD